MRARLLVLGGTIWLLAFTAQTALGSVPYHPTEPQMRLPYYLQDEATDRLRARNALLRPDPLPANSFARTRFVVVRKSGLEVRPSLEWNCVAAVFEPMASAPHASFSLTDTSPLQWLTGRFQFKEEPSWRSLEFVGEPRSFETYANDLGSKVKEGVTYRVAVRFEEGWAPAVERVLLGGEVIYDRSICALHGAKMLRFDVPIFWGSSGCDPLPSANGARPTSEQWAEFPHYIEQMSGGCIVPPGHPDTHPFYICSRCRDAFLAWRNQHGR